MNNTPAVNECDISELDGEIVDKVYKKFRDESVNFTKACMADNEEFCKAAIGVAYVAMVDNDKVKDMMYWKLGVDLVSHMIEKMKEETKKRGG